MKPNPTFPLEFEAEYKRLLAGAQRMLSEQKTQSSESDVETEKLPREFGDYTLIRQIGQGGMGRVYLASQNAADRQVALKIVRPDLSNDWTSAKRDIISRFKSEARTAARIDHDNIVSVYDVGQVAGCHYYSMRYIEGDNLAKTIRIAPVPEKRAARVLKAIAGAVQCSHHAGVLHRDLKPANILIGGDGRPYVADFGLAKSGSDDATALTRTGAILGTVEYMSPEQASDPKRVTEKSDVYSLGAVLYAMLVGRPPFLAATQVETLKQLYESEPVPPRKLNPAIARDLNTICLKCLAKSPADRYPSAGDLQSDLARFLNGEPIVAKPIGTIGRVSKWAGRNKALAALVTLIVLSIPTSLLAYNAARNNSLNTQVDYLIQSAWSSSPDKLPAIAAKLDEFGSRSTRELNAIKASKDPDTKFRHSYLLSRSDPQAIRLLSDRLGTLRPEELLLVQDLLASYREEAIPELLAEIQSQRINGARPFQVCCVIASSTANRKLWNGKADDIVTRLLVESPSNLAVFVKLLKPIGDCLCDPLFSRLSTTQSQSEKIVCSSLLCEFYEDNPKELLELLYQVNRENLGIVIEKLKRHPQHVNSSLIGKFRDQAPTNKVPSLTFAEVELQIRAGMALWAVNSSHEVIKYIELAQNPDADSLLVHSIIPSGIQAESVLAQLEQSNDNRTKHILLLALGEFDARYLPPAFIATAKIRLVDHYLLHADAGVHSAAKWVLNRWDIEVPKTDKSPSCPGNPKFASKWEHSENGHTFVKIFPPESILTGSPTDEPEHSVEEEFLESNVSPFCISTTEVTVEQFRRSGIESSHIERYGPDENCPVNTVTVYEAMKYCNWLNEQVGIPKEQWCYRYQIDDKGNPTAAFVDLTLVGHRLPTEAEWEYACRGGSKTASHFGTSRELLGNYAWFIGNSNNSSHEVGLLKPNRFGLFDTLGNLREWCHQVRNRKYDNPAIRGPGFMYSAKDHRAAWNASAMESHSSRSLGFRVTKTIANSK